MCVQSVSNNFDTVGTDHFIYFGRVTVCLFVCFLTNHSLMHSLIRCNQIQADCIQLTPFRVSMAWPITCHGKITNLYKQRHTTELVTPDLLKHVAALPSTAANVFAQLN